MQFDKQCKCKKSDECCMLLCRVTMGETLIEKKFRGNQKGQFWHFRRKEPDDPVRVLSYIVRYVAHCMEC